MKQILEGFNISILLLQSTWEAHSGNDFASVVFVSLAFRHDRLSHNYQALLSAESTVCRGVGG